MNNNYQTKVLELQEIKNNFLWLERSFQQSRQEPLPESFYKSIVCDRRIMRMYGFSKLAFIKPFIRAKFVTWKKLEGLSFNKSARSLGKYGKRFLSSTYFDSEQSRRQKFQGPCRQNKTACSHSTPFIAPRQNSKRTNIRNGKLMKHPFLKIDIAARAPRMFITASLTTPDRF